MCVCCASICANLPMSCLAIFLEKKSSNRHGNLRNCQSINSIHFLQGLLASTKWISFKSITKRTSCNALLRSFLFTVSLSHSKIKTAQVIEKNLTNNDCKLFSLQKWMKTTEISYIRNAGMKPVCGKRPLKKWILFCFIRSSPSLSLWSTTWTHPG